MYTVLVRHVARMVRMRNECKIVNRKPERKSSLVRNMNISEDNIKMYLKLMEYGDVDWIQPAQERDRNRERAIVNRVMSP
jgi:hypothetical protein